MSPTTKGLLFGAVFSVAVSSGGSAAAAAKNLSARQLKVFSSRDGVVWLESLSGHAGGGLAGRRIVAPAGEPLMADIFFHGQELKREVTPGSGTYRKITQSDRARPIVLEPGRYIYRQRDIGKWIAPTEQFEVVASSSNGRKPSEEQTVLAMLPRGPQAGLAPPARSAPGKPSSSPTKPANEYTAWAWKKVAETPAASISFAPLVRYATTPGFLNETTGYINPSAGERHEVFEKEPSGYAVIFRTSPRIVSFVSKQDGDQRAIRSFIEPKGRAPVPIELPVDLVKNAVKGKGSATAKWVFDVLEGW